MSKHDAIPIQRTRPEDEWNWARTHRFSAAQIERPSSNQQLQAVIAGAASTNRTVRCVGTEDTSIRAVEVATADGDLRRIDAQHAFAASDPTGLFRNAWFDTTLG
jgi:hypothetical protein